MMNLSTVLQSISSIFSLLSLSLYTAWFQEISINKHKVFIQNYILKGTIKKVTLWSLFWRVNLTLMIILMIIFCYVWAAHMSHFSLCYKEDNGHRIEIRIFSIKLKNLILTFAFWADGALIKDGKAVNVCPWGAADLLLKWLCTRCAFTNSDFYEMMYLKLEVYCVIIMIEPVMLTGIHITFTSRLRRLEKNMTTVYYQPHIRDMRLRNVLIYTGYLHRPRLHQTSLLQ